MSSAHRQHPRYAADVKIRFTVGKQVSEGRTRNVSRGGLCADLAVPLPVGTDVDLELTLYFEDRTKSEPLRLPARIVWCTQLENAHQIGVSFRPLDKHHAHYLSMFLKYLGDDSAPKLPKAANIDDRFR